MSGVNWKLADVNSDHYYSVVFVNPSSSKRYPDAYEFASSEAAEEYIYGKGKTDPEMRGWTGIVYITWKNQGRKPNMYRISEMKVPPW